MDSKSTKSFRSGAMLQTASSYKASDLASRSIKLVAFDEVDRMCASVPGGEGDPVALGMKRLTAFRDGKAILASTPTFAQTSRIAAWFDRSDKQLLHVVCPSCGVVAPLIKEPLHFEHDDPKTARLECLDCGHLSDEAERLRMIAGATWFSTSDVGEAGVIGFHANALASNFEVASNPSLAQSSEREHLIKGECSKTSRGACPMCPSPSLRLSAPIYKPAQFPSPRPTPPLSISLSLASTFRQTALNALTLASTKRPARSGFRPVVLNGDTSGAGCMVELDQALSRTFEIEGKRVLPLSAALVDSGFNTGNVVTFVSAQLAKGRRVFGSKGVTGFYQQPIREGSKNRGARHRVMLLGVDGLKVNVAKGLLLEPGKPNAIATPDHLQSDYWAQLSAERLDARVNNRGFSQMQWIKAPNENNESFRYGRHVFSGRVARQEPGRGDERRENKQYRSLRKSLSFTV